MSQNKTRGGPARRAYDPMIFKRVNAVLLANMDDFCGKYGNGGYIRGGEYIVRNPTRVDKSPGSFRINMKTGRWADFATGDRGGDPISYYAYVFGLSQIDAARELAADLGVN